VILTLFKNKFGWSIRPAGVAGRLAQRTSEAQQPPPSLAHRANSTCYRIVESAL
jgi:hypothetical protein